jgi:hypothetical protein
MASGAHSEVFEMHTVQNSVPLIASHVKVRLDDATWLQECQELRKAILWERGQERSVATIQDELQYCSVVYTPCLQTHQGSECSLRADACNENGTSRIFFLPMQDRSIVVGILKY